MCVMRELIAPVATLMPISYDGELSVVYGLRCDEDSFTHARDAVCIADACRRI